MPFLVIITYKYIFLFGTWISLVFYLFRALACELWRQVGTQWEKENEDDLKDKMDFSLSPTLQYPPRGEFNKASWLIVINTLQILLFGINTFRTTNRVWSKKFFNISQFQPSSIPPPLQPFW